MKYALSPEARLPENLSPLFSQASSEWQKVMKIVPGKHIRLLHPVQWTCDRQRNAAKHVLDAKVDVLAILATGAGKTMLTLFPTILDPDHISVIVLPLNSLLLDYKGKLGDIGYEAWSTNGEQDKPLAGASNLVFITIDQAHKQAFMAVLTQLNQ
ncbi:hypothetical protein PHLCEN_2v7068 [Hermanssonia centrifuga]|uniref:DEAD/DEAH-box helicase domain-containing protein n=1 Tax=Hermanssonia centrifuga TaxID=98765 RepID=A0A2R6NXR0_9APHY|nr:hypothetical protein PHLCEN_2v7068 [Hermanssonia centrifuga]